MKKIKIISLGLISIIVLTFSWHLFDRFSYSEEFPFYPVTVNTDTTLTIGIIGDSWVTNKRLDSLLQYGLLEAGFINKIISSGESGAKTKLIYQNLFKENKNEHSSKFIIENCPDYCIVIAGVNDAIAQIGGHYYSYHMCQIIKTLLHYKIRPIIISCPEFGIMESLDNLNFLSKYRNIISAYFNNKGEIDNIKSYRNILLEELNSENLLDSITLVDFDHVCSDYNKCPELYSNSSHLSRKGDERLCHLNIDVLVKKLISSNTEN
jgi:hypothetical protein